MGGGGSQSTSSNFTPGQAALQAKQAEVAQAVAPGLQDYMTGVLTGDPQKALGYATSMAGPIESSTQQALSSILSKTPRGGMQVRMMEQARQKGEGQRAQTQQDYINQALQMVARVFGQQAQPFSRTVTEPGLQTMDWLGPSIAGAAMLGSTGINTFMQPTAGAAVT